MYHCIRDCIHTKKVKSFNPHLIHREGFLPIEMYQISVSSPLSFRPLEIFSITILCSLTWEHENWTQWTQCIHSVSDEEHLGDHYILSSGLLCLIPCEISQDSETLVWWVAAFTDSYTKRLNVIWSMIASDKGWQSWVKFYYSYCRQFRCRWWLQGPAACTAGLEGHRRGEGGGALSQLDSSSCVLLKMQQFRDVPVSADALVKCIFILSCRVFYLNKMVHETLLSYTETGIHRPSTYLATPCVLKCL